MKISQSVASSEGFIGALKLDDWWQNALTEFERQELLSGFKPQSNRDSPLISGMIETGQGRGDFLANLAGWFENSNPCLAKKILDSAESFLNEQSTAKEKHFTYQALIQYYYKHSEVNPDNYPKAIWACRQQIAVSKQALQQILVMTDGFAPSHVGYKQLAIILEKEKRYTDAISLVQQAQAEGWAGDWDARLNRLNKKEKGA